jgi:RNAse (barnase) inhibitor barstar
VRTSAMAPLRWPEDRSRLDFDLLRESPVTLYRSREVLAEHVAWLRQHSYAVHEFDCSGWSSEEDFHDAASQMLGFPSYYGRNLDAFNDCLCGIAVPEEGGIVLAFRSFDVLHRLLPKPAWHILDIVARWSRFFLLTGRRMMALVQSDDPGLRIEPVGARPVRLNDEERRREMRSRLEAARRKSGDGTDQPG